MRAPDQAREDEEKSDASEDNEDREDSVNGSKGPAKSRQGSQLSQGQEESGDGNERQSRAEDQDEDKRDDDAQPTIKVTTTFQSTSLTLDPIIWKPHETVFLASMAESTPLQELLDGLYEDLVTLLESDSALKSRKKGISYRPSLQLSPNVTRYANPDSYGITHVDSLRDLFPSVTKKAELPITVNLTESEETIRSKEAKDILRNDWVQPYTFYRVGTLQVTENNGYGALPRSSQQYTVVAWYEDDKTETLQRLRFTNVPTWYVNDLEIGDVYRGENRASPPSGLTIDDIYQDISTKSQIHKFLSNAENHEAVEKLKSNVPKMTSHCFNPKADKIRHVGLKTWPMSEESITVTGPFLHYDNGERAVDFKRPETFRIQVRESHDMNGIYEMLESELQRRSGGKTSKGKASKNKSGKHKYDLWVLPQGNGVSKMLRYSKGKVTRFMTPKGVQNKQDVYMEAHIIPMDVDTK